jgi:hypothetical protein
MSRDARLGILHAVFSLALLLVLTLFVFPALSARTILGYAAGTWILLGSCLVTIAQVLIYISSTKEV